MLLKRFIIQFTFTLTNLSKQ